MQPIPATFALLLAASPIPAQSVLIVDDDGGAGVDFTSLAAALSAAQAGDTLLMRSGTYDDAGPLNRHDIGVPLRIVADVGADVQILDTLRFEGVDSGAIVLRELTIFAPDPTVPAYLSFTDCDAPIWIEDCVSNADGQAAFPLIAGLVTEGCADVIALRSEFTGSMQAFFSPLGAGIYSVDSNLHLFDCIVQGHQAGTSVGAGAHLNGSTLFASGSTFTGGPGLDSFVFSCGTDGGAGVLLNSSAVTFLDSDAIGGPAGADRLCGTAIDGPAFSGGAPNVLSGSARHYRADSIALVGSTAQHSWSGEPGDISVLLFGTEPTAISLGNVAGTLLMGGGLTIVQLVPMPTGSLDLSFDVPSIGTLSQLPIFLQGAFLAGPDAFLGPGSAQLLL